MNNTLKQYSQLRKKQIPFLRCGETVVPAYEGMPGYLQAAIFLAENIDSAKGTKRAKTAFDDVAKWMMHLEEISKQGHDVVDELQVWAKIANLLRVASGA